MLKVFTLLLRPIEGHLSDNSSKIDIESGSKKLFFTDFVTKMLFSIVYQCDSLRNLSLELQTNPICKDLGLSYTPFSTLKDGFSRFDSEHFKSIFEHILSILPFNKVAYLNELGLFKVIDGSLFPTLLQMNWTSYRQKANAFKVHLSFELNRMIPTEFIIQSGNSSERTALMSMLQKGVTYIADRGYFSFEIIKNITQSSAFFIFRLKENTLFVADKQNVIDSETMPTCFKNVTDQNGVFLNDSYNTQTRMISFNVWDSTFIIATNRFDLSTINIIILYAYRWQIELFFKYFKRTLNGIHLFNHSENGLQTQFYLMNTLALLELYLKQSCQAAQNFAQSFRKLQDKTADILSFDGQSPADWIKNIAQHFYIFWKISKNWLLVLKNTLNQIVDNQIIKLLAVT
jgi:hypothetical protein